MRAGIKTKLEKLNRRVPPTWEDLTAVIIQAGERLDQAEVNAYLGHVRGQATPEQVTLWGEWMDRNKSRIWAVWDEKFPRWQDAPFWEVVGAEYSEQQDHEQD